MSYEIHASVPIKNRLPKNRHGKCSAMAADVMAVALFQPNNASDEIRCRPPVRGYEPANEKAANLPPRYVLLLSRLSPEQITLFANLRRVTDLPPFYSAYLANATRFARFPGTPRHRAIRRSRRQIFPRNYRFALVAGQQLKLSYPALPQDVKRPSGAVRTTQSIQS